MNRRATIFAPATVLVLALLTGGWFLQAGVEREENVYVQARLLEEVVDHIAESFVESVDRDELYRDALEGVLDGLDDPNTSLLAPEEYEQFRSQTEGDYGGVGLEIQERDGWVTVVTPLPGTPGSNAGIRAGDRFYEVEGESAEDWSVDQVVDALRGEPDTDVDVKMQRPGMEEPLSFTLTRAEIQLHSVPFHAMLEAGVGYVPLNLFSETSSQEVQEALQALEEDGMAGLILDLRGNPGGVLDQGLAVADLFLPEGSDVVETRGQDDQIQQSLRAGMDEILPDLPLVILLDQTSASASEIVAGALQDHDRAVLVGGTSFGKGSVQSLFQLSGGNVLQLTTAQWYTPAGRSIHAMEADEEELVEQLEEAQESGAFSLTGQLVPEPDTADRPTVESFAGRTLYGGGGITPDLLVMPDTLEARESQAVRTLFEQAGADFEGASFEFAVEYLQEHTGVGQDFELTDEDLDRFRGLLEERGAEVDADVIDDARRFVILELERRVAEQEWGEEGEFQRLRPVDTQLRRAVELLEEAEDQESLFRQAGTPLPEGAPAEAEEEASWLDGLPDGVHVRAASGGSPGGAEPR